MKKILGVLGVSVIAAMMFFSANNSNNVTSDVSLASLITLNKANAENGDDFFEKVLDCTVVERDSRGNYHSYDGQELVCYGGFSPCTEIPCARNVVIGF